MIVASSAGAAAFLGPNPPALPWGEEPAGGVAAHSAEAHADGPLRVERAADGVTPTREDALLRLERRGNVMIRSDADWNPANGVRSGSGTPADPFVISGFHVDVLYVADTTRCFEITENWVARILIVDWTGSCGLVHHNHLENFRTNRNVERTGDPTAAVVTRNEIVRVEELRHFDGVLTENVIGRPPSVKDAPLVGDVSLPRNGVVLNVAGLNGADISRNAIFGGVDMKLHGHHHSDGSGAHSHNHGTADDAQNQSRPEDHGVRFVDFLFRDNTIVDDGFGLRYNDLNHAGDDRTATSEQEPALELPHYHFTTVRVVNNVIEGRGLRVSVFNAPDERHLGQQGRVVLEGNIIREPAAGSAVIVQDVQDAVVVVSGNQVDKAALKIDESPGILLTRFKNATVRVEGNALPGFAFGIAAHEFDAATTWTVIGNQAPDAKQDVYWDSSVANPPNSEPADDDDAHADHEHAHEQGAAPRGIIDGVRVAPPT